VLRLGSRIPSGVREESYGSRRWTEVAQHAASPHAAVWESPAAGFTADRSAFERTRPDWHVEARVRVRIGTGSARARRRAFFAAAMLALAIGLGATLRGGRVARPTPHAAPESARGGHVAPAPAIVPAVQVDELALEPPVAERAPYAGAALVPAPALPPPMPAPATARLEGITAIRGVRRASFRVGDRTIALGEGDEIGGRAIAVIGDDQVALVGGGVAARVRLGFETPLQ